MNRGALSTGPAVSFPFLAVARPALDTRHRPPSERKMTALAQVPMEREVKRVRPVSFSHASVVTVRNQLNIDRPRNA